MPCSTCTDDARCDRLGLCQDVAKIQLPGPEPVMLACRECSGSGLTDTSGFGDLDACDECGGSGRAKH